MRERREDLPFAPEALHREVGAESSLDDLDRNALAILVVGTHGLVDRAHAAEPDAPNDLVGTEAVAVERRAGRGSHERRRPFDAAVGAF